MPSAFKSSVHWKTAQSGNFVTCLTASAGKVTEHDKITPWYRGKTVDYERSIQINRYEVYVEDYGI